VPRSAFLGTGGPCGNLTGHAANGKKQYRRYCIGCHGPLGDGDGENAPWIDPKPRDFTTATFKCRSTPTGTLPRPGSVQIGRSWFQHSNMPHWDALIDQDRIDLVAYIKSFSPRWQSEKPGQPNCGAREPAVTKESITHGGELFQKMECWKCHGQQGRGDGPSASTLTDSKDQPIRPYNFADGADDSRFKCGETNQDLYRIFMAGVDGTPMPSFADVIQPVMHGTWFISCGRCRPTGIARRNNGIEGSGGKVAPQHPEIDGAQLVRMLSILGQEHCCLHFSNTSLTKSGVLP